MVSIQYLSITFIRITHQGNSFMPPGPLWAEPLWALLGPCGPGHCGPPWALVGLAPVGGPGPLWARPLWAALGTFGLGPCGPPWALLGWALMGLSYKQVTLVGKISK